MPFDTLPPFTMLWPALFAVLGSAGVWLVVRWGWVGLFRRKSGDGSAARLCRRCHYDLTGLPESSGNCPECGADLRVAGARVAPRSRGTRVLSVASGVMLMAAVGWFGVRVR